MNDAEGLGLTHEQGVAPADTDGDGMPDEWERAHGLDATNADDRNLVNGEGYTALEVYLNSLMGETLDDDFTSGITQPAIVRPVIGYDRATETLTVSDNAVGSTLDVYTTDGRMVATRIIRSTSTQLMGLPKGVLLMRVSGNGVAPRLLKIAR